MNTLYDDYKEFEQLANSCDEEFINLNEEFFKPTILTPLINFLKTNKMNFKLNDSLINNKFFNDDDFVNFIELDYIKENRKGEIIENLAKNINHEDYCGLQSIIYILNELVSNVIDHSSLRKDSFSKCYIFTKEYPNLNLLDICIMDNGLSIPGKFEIHHIDFLNDCDAISKAVNQLSTQKHPYYSIKYSRGFGLWSTLKLVIEGNGGNALIVSRNGCLNIIDKDNYKYYYLNNSNIFKGTLISLRLKKDRIENFYNLIEISDSNSYKYMR